MKIISTETSLDWQGLARSSWQQLRNIGSVRMFELTSFQFIGSVIMVIGAAIQCSSFSLGQLIASRFITGFGNGNYPYYDTDMFWYWYSRGMNTSTVPTWQAETSKSHRRGQMVMIEGDTHCVVLLSQWFWLLWCRYSHRLWCYDFLLDWLGILIPRAVHHHLAIPYRIPDPPCTNNSRRRSRTAGITTLVSQGASRHDLWSQLTNCSKVDSQGTRARSVRSAVRSLGPPRRWPCDSERVQCCQGYRFRNVSRSIHRLLCDEQEQELASNDPRIRESDVPTDQWYVLFPQHAYFSWPISNEVFRY